MIIQFFLKLQIFTGKRETRQNSSRRLGKLDIYFVFYKIKMQETLNGKLNYLYLNCCTNRIDMKIC